MRPLSISFLLFLACASTSAALPAASSYSKPIVTTTNGTFVGATNSEYNQEYFLGIPYAQPPIGELRFRPPRPVTESWTQKKSDEYGAWCLSAPLSLPGFTQSGFTHQESEDCLTMNVIRPVSTNESSGLPVLVWIYGGGLQEGGSADQRYNMSFIVQESVNMGSPIVAVSFNYRVSGFGFLPGRVMHEAGATNLGLYDQRLALHWIHENIEAFGGDPTLVTIAGESSGGISVGHHFLAFGGRDDGLFRAGIAESGGPLTSSALLSVEQQDLLYDKVVASANCTTAADSLECLRSQPASRLKSIFQGISYYPVIDGGIITEMPSTALHKGNFVQRPILIGTNTNEGATFGATIRGMNNSVQFRQLVTLLDAGQQLSQKKIDNMVDIYTLNMTDSEAQHDLETVLLTPSSAYGKLWGKAMLYIGDIIFNAPRRYAASMWAKYSVPAFSYRFDAIPHGIPHGTLGAGHFQEVAYVFRNLDGVGYETDPFGFNSTALKQEHGRLSILMSRMWLSFVNTLSPNNHKLDNFNQTWPAYDFHAGHNLVFRTNNSTLELDDWRREGIKSIMHSLKEYRL